MRGDGGKEGGRKARGREGERKEKRKGNPYLTYVSMHLAAAVIVIYLFPPLLSQILFFSHLVRQRLSSWSDLSFFPFPSPLWAIALVPVTR